MRFLLIFVACVSGCTWNTKPCPPVVDVPVYTKPNIKMPVKPVLRSDANTSDVELIRNIELDILDITTYATSLENLLKEIDNGGNSK